LLELLVAGLLLSIISVMIYSVLNVGIKFAHKGEVELLAIAREQGFISLLQQQVRSTLYDSKKKKLEITIDDDVLRLVTRRPLLYHQVDVVLAIYRYKADDRTVYYTEKVDYYNPDFAEGYLPDYEEMYPVISTAHDFAMEFDEKTGEVFIEYEETEYLFKPRSWPRQS
jgi:hypothetical protein